LCSTVAKRFLALEGELFGRAGAGETRRKRRRGWDRRRLLVLVALGGWRSIGGLEEHGCSGWRVVRAGGC
jgi:hypothetical protein